MIVYGRSIQVSQVAPPCALPSQCPVHWPDREAVDIYLMEFLASRWKYTFRTNINEWLFHILVSF